MRLLHRRHSRLLAVLCAALGVAACGGTANDPRPEKPTGSGGDAALDLGSCEELVEAFEFWSIESFEGGSTEDTGTSDLAGWWVSNDGTNDGNHGPYDWSQATACQVNANGPNDCRDMFPREGGAPDLSSADASCEATGHAMRLHSGPPGFSDWGLTFGSNFRDEFTDGTEWHGIGFWARHGEDSAVKTFNATLPDRHTSNQDATGGANYECRDGLSVENLCDPFGRGIRVTEEWRFYLLPFEELSQQGFGKASPLGMLDVAEILGMSFQVGAGTWDIWVDEIVYYRER